MSDNVIKSGARFPSMLFRRIIALYHGRQGTAIVILIHI